MRVAACCLALALQATFSAHADMAVLPVTVTDAHGHSVAGLSSDDFRVYDEGRLQTIALFRSGEVPITLGLIVDESQSMRPKIAAVDSALSAFAGSGRPDDEMFVVAFNDEVRVLPLQDGRPFTADPAVLGAALATEKPVGTTALYDAVALGLHYLSAGHADRRALIVVSDGGDNASRLKYGQVRDLARASQAVIYGVGLLGADNEYEAPDVLKQLCRDSGGAAYFPAATDGIASAIAEIGRDLREQYTIGFVPDAATTGHRFHAIAVTARGRDGVALQVRTRAGYDSGGLP
jgi:Ca-activated chloride channel family protein